MSHGGVYRTTLQRNIHTMTRPSRYRNANVPKEVASDRMDVSPAVLYKHYDQAPESERRERRQELLKAL